MTKRNTLIIGGGNMIYDLTTKSDSARYFLRYVNLAKKLRKRVFVLSIGVGPFQTEAQRQKAINALNKCDAVSFRDKESLNIIMRNNASNGRFFLSADPVFMLPLQKINTTSKSNRTIGIGAINPLLLGLDMRSYQQILHGYIALANRFAREGYDIVVFSTEQNDYAIVNDIVRECANPAIVNMQINGIEELFRLLSGMPLLVAARMHSLIVAYTQLVPVIGLSWQNKIDAFFEIIGEKDSVFPIDELENYVEQIIELAQSKEASSYEYKQSASQQLKQIRELIRVNVKLLRN